MRLNSSNIDYNKLIDKFCQHQMERLVLISFCVTSPFFVCGPLRSATARLNVHNHNACVLDAEGEEKKITWTDDG